MGWPVSLPTTNIQQMASNSQAVALLTQRLKVALKTLPKKVGNEVVNFAKDNFRNQAFAGAAMERWPPRKAVTKWGKTPRNKGRALLIDTGRLRRSIRVVSATWDRVAVGSDAPYAKAHNDGFRGEVTQHVPAHQRKVNKVGVIRGASRKTRSNISFGRVDTGRRVQVKAHTRKIKMRLPKRQFLGASPYLAKRLNHITAAAIMRAANQP